MGSGLSKNRLELMRRVLSGYVENRMMPGLVALVSRDDDTYVGTIGTLAFDSGVPMKSNSIFRIASLSKLITAVAAMVLVEECRIRLDDTIEPWLPELANRRVLKTLSSQLDETDPASRSITVRDLFTYRMGFGSVMAAPGTFPIQRLIREYRIGGDGPPLPCQGPGLEEWLQRLGSLPLMAQPGSQWMYHVSGDVLGALIARVSGQSLGNFMRNRIFDPLGMKDTAFFVSPDKKDRFTASYRTDSQPGGLAIFDNVSGSAWGSEPPFESGGGGLVSTIDDYLVFCRMMLNKGKHGTERILSRAAMDLMASDQLTPEQRLGAQPFLGNHSSWGLGMAVDIGRTEVFHSPGRFGWTGGLGTTAYVDPANRTIGILFSQRMMDSPEPLRFFTDFWTLAYGTIE